MRKLFIAFVLVVLTSSFCLAQQTIAPVKQAPVVSKPDMALTGKIGAVTLADTVKGIKAGLEVLKDDGTKVTFVIEVKTVIHDASMKVIAPDKLNKGDKVQVKYSLDKSGVNEAIMVDVLK